MMTTVLSSRSDENFIVGPRTVAQRVRRMGRGPLTLQWGRRSLSVAELRVRVGRGVRLYLSPRVLRESGLRPGTRLHIAQDANRRRLRIGPVFGIFACYLRGDPTLYGQGSFFRALVSAAKPRGVCAYVFAPADIDWEQGTVRGLVPGGRGRGWVRDTFPLPEVVYNRVQNRSLEDRPDVQRTLDRFEKMRGVALFNRRFLNKWDVHSLLGGRPELARSIPRTEKLLGAVTVRSMFARADRLFVKPVDGSLGSDISVLWREPDGTYSYNYYSEDGTVTGRRCPSPDALWAELGPQLSPRPFIVQEAIRLAEHRGRCFDIRIIAQRGRRGNWRVASMYARVAARGEPRTNVTAGGRAMPWRRVLRAAFGRRARFVARELLRTARALADGFAAAHESLVGELAIDIGIDARGRSWLIELNSKPVRRIGSRISLRRPPLSLTSLLDFGKTLAGF